MAVEKMKLSDRVQRLAGMLAVFNDERFKHTCSIERLDKNMAVLDLLLKEAQSKCCGYCRGFGNVTVQYAQDEVKIETCERCKGTGEQV